MLRHGATYAGHPTCAAAALAVLDAYEAEGLIARGRELEVPLRDALAPLADHDAVGEVRAGSACSARSSCPTTRWPRIRAPSRKVAAGAREAGVLVRPLLRGVAALAAADRRRVAPRRAGRGDPRGARAALTRAGGFCSPLW